MERRLSFLEQLRSRSAAERKILAVAIFLAAAVVLVAASIVSLKTTLSLSLGGFGEDSANGGMSERVAAGVGEISGPLQTIGGLIKDARDAVRKFSSDIKQISENSEDAARGVSSALETLTAEDGLESSVALPLGTTTPRAGGFSDASAAVLQSAPATGTISGTVLPTSTKTGTRYAAIAAELDVVENAAAEQTQWIRYARALRQYTREALRTTLDVVTSLLSS